MKVFFYSLLYNIIQCFTICQNGCLPGLLPHISAGLKTDILLLKILNGSETGPARVFHKVLFCKS